jgi:nucleoside-diphosphate-sugar epimerase
VGKTYNVGHQRVLTVRGIAHSVARAMDHDWEVVSVLSERLPPTNPYASAYHIVYDLSRIQADLGYRESVSLAEGMRRTVEWLLANPPTPQTWGLARYLTDDAFDYSGEDAAMATAKQQAAE